MNWENCKVTTLIAQVKETWAEGEVDSLSAFDDWEYIAQVLKDRFIEQVQDKNEKEFREYLINDRKINVDEKIKKTFYIWIIF